MSPNSFKRPIYLFNHLLTIYYYLNIYILEVSNPLYSIANLGGLYYLHSYLQSKEWFLKQLLNRYTHTITVNQYKVKTNWKILKYDYMRS